MRVNVPDSLTQKRINEMPELAYNGDKIVKKQVDIPEWMDKFSKDAGVPVTHILRVLSSLESSSASARGTLSEGYTLDSKFAGSNRFYPNMNPRPRPDSFIDELPEWISETDARNIAIGNEIVHPKVRPQVQGIIRNIANSIIPSEEHENYKEGFRGFRKWTNMWNLYLQYDGAPEECPKCGQSVYELGDYGENVIDIIGKIDGKWFIKCKCGIEFDE